VAPERREETLTSQSTTKGQSPVERWGVRTSIAAHTCVTNVKSTCVMSSGCSGSGGGGGILNSLHPRSSCRSCLDRITSPEPGCTHDMIPSSSVWQRSRSLLMQRFPRICSDNCRWSCKGWRASDGSPIHRSYHLVTHTWIKACENVPEPPDFPSPAIERLAHSAEREA
jgi:hypothetical protein